MPFRIERTGRTEGRTGRKERTTKGENRENKENKVRTENVKLVVPPPKIATGEDSEVGLERKKLKALSMPSEKLLRRFNT